MNKIFHEKMNAGKLCFLFVEIAIFTWFAWFKMPVPALLFLVAVVYTLEMLLHSTYTVTGDGKLVIYKGRFLRITVISLSEVDRIESNHYSFNAGLRLGSYLLIVLKSGKEVGIRPEKEQEFIEYIEYKQTHIAQHEQDNEED